MVSMKLTSHMPPPISPSRSLTSSASSMVGRAPPALEPALDPAPALADADATAAGCALAGGALRKFGSSGSVVCGDGDADAAGMANEAVVDAGAARRKENVSDEPPPPAPAAVAGDVAATKLPLRLPLPLPAPPLNPPKPPDATGAPDMLRARLGASSSSGSHTDGVLAAAIDRPGAPTPAGMLDMRLPTAAEAA